MRPEFYGQLILAGKQHGAFVALDADGAALAEGIEAGPDLIKPNIHELERLVGRTLTDEASILAACTDLHARNLPLVLVSRGKEGLLLSAPEQQLRAVAPPVEADSTVGAGDSVVGGFLLAHSRGQDLADCLRLACAAGTATAGTPGSELCHLPDVERILPQVLISTL